MTTRPDLYIVDDTEDYRFLLQQVFSRFLSQYTVRFFTSGDELYTYMLTANKTVDQRAKSGSEPGLILLDLNMPGLGGYQTLLLLKQHPQWQHIPVVMMSNTGSIIEMDQCYRGGASSFLSKPSDFDQLKQLMETLCLNWLAIHELPAL